MLDFGFSELVVIGVVALIVIGPERLPRVARTAGHLLGRFQRYVAEVKADISREMELAELKKLQSSVEDAARSIEQSVKTGMDDAQKEFRDVQTALENTGAELKKTEDALKEAVSSVQMPHMGTGSPNGSEQVSAEGASSVEAMPASISAPGSGGAHVASTEFSTPQNQSGPSSSDDQSSPQMELGLDSPAQETLTQRRA